MKRKWQIVLPSDFESTKKEYRLNGRQYQRVTSTLDIIAKPFLFGWYKRVGEEKANRVLETRQAIGVHVHKLCELTLQGEVFNLGTYETEIQEDMKQFNIFKVVCKLKAEGLEQRVWSNEYGYAGTADFVGYYQSYKKLMTRGHKTKFDKSSFVIGDWKTGKAFYRTYWLQLAAYAMAFFELTGVKVKGVFIARMRDGRLTVQEKTWEELMPEFEAYKHALALYKWEHRIID